MKIDPTDPIHRMAMIAIGLIIYGWSGYSLHQVFVKKLKIRAKWGRFGGGRVLSRFAFASWSLIFFVIATDFIYFAASRGEQVPFKGVMYFASCLAIISAAIYDYSRKEKIGA